MRGFGGEVEPAGPALGAIEGDVRPADQNLVDQPRAFAREQIDGGGIAEAVARRDDVGREAVRRIGASPVDDAALRVPAYCSPRAERPW